MARAYGSSAHLLMKRETTYGQSATGDYIGSDFDFVRLFTQVHWMRPAFRLGRRQLIWAQA